MSFILVICAILLGYLRKGSLKNLSELKVKFIPLILLSFAIQVGIYLGYAYNIEVVQDFDILLHFISYIVLFAGLMANFDNKWFILITLGVVLNFLVIFLNGGRMPISYDAALSIGMNSESMDAFLLSRAGTHQKLASGALLWFLSDILAVNFPDFLNFFDNIYSAGDIVLYIGAIGFIQSAMTSSKIERIEEEEKEDLEEEIKGEYQVDQAKLSYDALDSENHMDDLYTKNFSTTIENSTEEISTKGLGESKTSDSKEDLRGETIVFHLEDMDNGEGAVAFTSHITLDDEEMEMIESSREEVIQASEEEEIQLGEEEIESIGEEEIQLGGEEIGSRAEEDVYTPQIEENALEETIESATEVALSHEIREDGVQLEEELIEMKQIEEVVIKDTKEKLTKAPDAGIVDTTNRFIIVDGKIKENPNYKSPQVIVLNQATEDSEIEKRVHKLGEQVEELQMSQIDLVSQEKDRNENKDKNILQKISDGQRVDLMKKMRERKENGYTLIEVKVGDKKVNFWKKDL